MPTGAVLTREERLERLHRRVTEQPTITDAELARELRVSIHTIRADRQRLGIPEARQRAKDLATSLYAKAKSLTEHEIVGELLEVEPDREGLSLLEIVPEMCFKKSGIARGHVLFAQANSLAAATVDADVALTAECAVEFIAPVRVGERILAKARVTTKEGRRREVEVAVKSRERMVLTGRFVLYGLSKEIAAHLKILDKADRGGEEEDKK